MANRIKGITVEIGGDTTKLQNALKGVNSQIKSTQAQLKDVDKLLKLDPGNTDLITQKHKLLQQAVEETKQKLETLKTAATNADKALAEGTISQEQYDALQREIIETEQDLKKLEAAAKESANAMEGIVQKGEQLKTAGDKVSSVGEKFLPVTAGVAALGTAAVKTAADFDASMSKVSAVSGATGKDFDALKKKAREMGAKTKFSASEAAEAMNYMAMAGWKTEDMLSGIEGVMNLAAASGEDLATTSDIVTDALTAFGLTAKDSGHFADVLAAASSNANTNVSMMGETFKYAAPIAGSLGYSIEDTAEAIGLMANAGIKSSQAGTSLRKIMTELNGDIKISGQNIGDVTIKTANADGTMREFGDILADCRTAFSGLTESEKAATAESLVGKTAMSGFLALMNAAPSDIEKLNGAIGNCNGKAEEMAMTMQDNLEGQLTILKSQLQELAISFGELLMPAVRAIVTGIQGFVNVLNKMPDGVKKVVMVIALLAAAIGPVLIVVGKTMSAVGTIMTYAPKIVSTIKLIGTGMKALWGIMAANPVVLIIAAIVALVAGFIYLWNTSESFRNFWINLWNGIKTVVSTAVEGIKNFFSGIITFFQNNWQGLLTFIANPFVGGFKLLYDNCDGFREFIDGFLAGVKQLFVNIGAGIVEVFNNVCTTITTIWTAISTVFTTVLTAICTLHQTVWTTIQTVITTVLGVIKSIISTVWEGIKTTVTTVMNTIKTTVTNVWNSVKTAISTTVGQIYDTIFNGFEKATGYVKGLASQAFNWGRDMIMGIVNGIKSVIDKVSEAATNVADKIKEVLHFSRPDTGPLREYEKWMPDFMSGLAGGINRSKHLVSNAMNGLAKDMVISPSLDTSNFATANGMTLSSGGNTDLIGAIKTAVSEVCAAQGDTIIPVYIGQERIDEIVLRANRTINYRSGGR